MDIEYQEAFQDTPIYSRSRVNYKMDKSGKHDQGAGWTEYYKVKYCLRGIFRAGAILDFLANWR